MNPAPPSKVLSSQDSNVEMKWQTFAGLYSDIYALIIHQRAIRDYGSDTNLNLGDYVKAHLERGLLGIQNRRDLYHLIAPSITAAQN